MSVLKGTVHNELYYIVHPLDDVPETKRDTSSLGLMPMTRSVKYSLMALRLYLVGMGGLVLFHVFQLAGMFR
jgi:hypothetical protein